MIEVLFWIPVIAVFHSYVLFPFSLWIINYFVKNKNEQYNAESDELPFISVVMSVFNEEQVIIEKLESVYKSDYPADRFEVIIGSDNSTDKTNEMIAQYASQHASLNFTVFSVRQGKPNVVNQLVKKAKGSLLLFTDANVMFDRKTISSLVDCFNNPGVGLVDANMINRGMVKDGISFQENAYISREVIIKNYEGRIWGAMMGPFGGCYAIRKELFTAVPENYLVDDFFINMKILEKGYAAINNVKAIVFEDVSNDLNEEFRRKIRIATGNFQNLATFRKLLLKSGGVGYCFLSHKILRWFGPVFIIMSIVFSGLLGMDSELYRFLFLIQLFGLSIPFIDFLLRKIGIHIIILRFITHFYSMNFALLVGFIKYLKGVKTNVWQPTKRNQ